VHNIPEEQKISSGLDIADSVSIASGINEQIERCILSNEEDTPIKFHVKWELAMEGNGAWNGLRTKIAGC
jgi:hypothetical protein